MRNLSNCETKKRNRYIENSTARIIHLTSKGEGAFSATARILSQKKENAHMFLPLVSFSLIWKRTLSRSCFTTSAVRFAQRMVLPGDDGIQAFLDLAHIKYFSQEFYFSQLHVDFCRHLGSSTFLQRGRFFASASRSINC